MNYRKTFNRITLIVLFTIAVVPLIWSIALHTAEANSLFKPAVNYFIGFQKWPKSVAIGDFNGDKKLDLATANFGTGTSSVLLGNGDGTFQSAVDYGAGDGPTSVAISDLNGDGDLDLAVANGGGQVSVLLGNGDGTFKSTVNYDAPNDLLSVAIGDLDGDGSPDLAVGSDIDNSVSVLLGKGDGTFKSTVVYDAGGRAFSVAIGYLNGDTNLDLAVAADNGVSVLLGKGDGSFQNPVSYGTGKSSRSVDMSDFNGDKKLDLAVANLELGVSVLLGKGDGTFQSAVSYGADATPWSVAIDDLNGDYNPDLAIANRGSDNVSVLLGKGDGTFQSAENYGAGYEPWSVALGDLNNDTNLDLAVANTPDSEVSILINTGGITKLLYTPVTPCRIVDTRKTSAGVIAASTQRDFHVYGNGGTIGPQGGNSAGCPAPSGEPLAALINLVVANPTGGGNMQAFAVGGVPGANLGVNFADIGSNRANAGIVKTSLGTGPDITVASRFSSAHAVIDVLGYYYPNGNLLYTPVSPCRIADTRKSGGMIGANTQRNFHVYGSGSTIGFQGGNSAGCTAPLDDPLAAHINLVVANPTGKGNMQAFAVGGKPGANLGVNFSASSTTSNQCANPAECPPPPWTNFANAGIVETSTGAGSDITVTSRFSSAHAVLDVLGYYYSGGDFAYTPVAPCRIVDTRKTSAGMIGASTERDFHVFGAGITISVQGGNSAGCPTPAGEPLAAHINLVVANPTGQGNMQAFAVGGTPGANLSVNFADIGTNFANVGTIQAATGSGRDITVTSRYSSAHAVIDVLGYYYPAP